jgi:hypothetical protein
MRAMVRPSQDCKTPLVSLGTREGRLKPQMATSEPDITGARRDLFREEMAPRNREYASRICHATVLHVG